MSRRADNGFSMGGLFKVGLVGLAGYFIVQKFFPNFQWCSILPGLTCPPANYKPPGGDSSGGGSSSGSGSGSSSGTNNPPPAATVKLAGPVSQLGANFSNALQANVSINGSVQNISIIPSSGRAFNSAGADITDSLTSQGVDVAALLSSMQAGMNATPQANAQQQISALQNTLAALQAQLTPGLQASQPGTYSALQAQVNQIQGTIAQLKAAAGLQGLAGEMGRYTRVAADVSDSSRFRSRFN